MNMREAIEKTLALHQMVVDGKHLSYIDARILENNDDCYLCFVVNCKECPWMIIEGKTCGCRPHRESYRDSPQSIIRLNRWLADPRIDKS